VPTGGSDGRLSQPDAGVSLVDDGGLDLRDAVPECVPLTADDIDALYRCHARAMVTFFARRTLDPEAAVDLVAETFAVAIAERSRCRGLDREEQAAWLYGIARNHLRGWYRRGAIERRALERVGIDRPSLIDGDVERIEELSGFDELRSRIAALVEDLPSEARVAVRMRIVEERSYPEIASVLGISEQNVRARVSRALRTLAGRLEHERSGAGAR
jgi:RNA polymerase sigma factor (sigma-70 family)